MFNANLGNYWFEMQNYFELDSLFIDKGYITYCYDPYVPSSVIRQICPEVKKIILGFNFLTS